MPLRHVCGRCLSMDKGGKAALHGSKPKNHCYAFTALLLFLLSCFCA